MALIKHKTPEIVIVQFLSNSGYDEEKINKIIAELQATENLWNVHVS
jgi:LPS sulfotransferase NodH